MLGPDSYICLCDYSQDSVYETDPSNSFMEAFTTNRFPRTSHQEICVLLPEMTLLVLMTLSLS